MEHEFKPKEWVLTRDTDDDDWTLNIFSHKDGGRFHCVFSVWLQCIPYEGNEHLLGTDKPADAPIELGGWKVGDKVEVKFCWDEEWYPGEIVKIAPEHKDSAGDPMPFKVKSECFDKHNPSGLFCAADQIRRPEEKDGKKKEKFSFGDSVQYRRGCKWHDGKFVLDDNTRFRPFLIYIPEENNTAYFEKEDVRRA